MANKYKWNICPRCHLAYIPWKEKQTYCSFWCEMLDEKKARGLMNDEEYIANELAAINLEWKEQYINDIKENGIGSWYTIGECGTVKRFYKIVPFNKCDTHGMVLGTGQYFVLYEALGIESDKASPVAIYESLDDAKERAKMQLLVINNIIKTYCPQND